VIKQIITTLYKLLWREESESGQARLAGAAPGGI